MVKKTYVPKLIKSLITAKAQVAQDVLNVLIKNVKRCAAP